MKKYKFIYIDHKQKDQYLLNGRLFTDGRIILAVDGTSITEADAVYEKTFGVNIMKHQHVGCCIVPQDNK